MPNWIGDQMAEVRPETPVSGGAILPLVTFEISPSFRDCRPSRACPGWTDGRTESPRVLLLAGGRDAVIKLGELVMILDLHRFVLRPVSAIARQV